MKKILIIEDEELLNKIFCDELSDAGYITFPAFNGKSALSILAKERPDLLILDIKLPDIDGMVLLKKIRKEKAGVPVIICSAYEKEIKEMPENTEYIVKPVELKKLKKKIKRLISAA